MTESRYGQAFYVAGVNGVGKNAVLDEAIARRPEIIKPFYGSAMLMEKLGIERGDYENLRKVSEKEAIAAFDDVMEEVLAKRSIVNQEVLMLNVHLFNIRKGRMLDRSKSPWIRDVDAIVVVTTDKQTLLERINSDQRDRDLFPADSDEEKKVTLLGRYLNRTLGKAKQISHEFGIPFYEIPNPKGKLPEAVDKLLEIVDELAPVSKS